METIDLVIEIVNSFKVPVWIPAVLGVVLRFIELKWNIFTSPNIIPKKHK